MRGRRVGRGIVWLLSLVVLLLSGCVKRTILIQSDPPGATVFINGHQAGVTPLDYPFIIHGRYRFTVSMKGFPWQFTGQYDVHVFFTGLFITSL